MVKYPLWCHSLCSFLIQRTIFGLPFYKLRLCHPGAEVTVVLILATGKQWTSSYVTNGNWQSSSILYKNSIKILVKDLI